MDRNSVSVEPASVSSRLPTAWRATVQSSSRRALFRIAPELRSLVKFQRLNFMHDDFGIGDPMAVIFCRNVLIYFDKPTQERLLNRLCRYLIPGGYLFTGHSETLHGMSLPLEQTATTVYRRQA